MMYNEIVFKKAFFLRFSKKLDILIQDDYYKSGSVSVCICPLQVL